ncbi:MAG: hypothetical protein JKY48_15315 [Flavobacteriales bacterium]|nr:hypothetical protein [Flavobacteriales bacterium]
MKTNYLRSIGLILLGGVLTISLSSLIEEGYTTNRNIPQIPSKNETNTVDNARVSLCTVSQSVTRRVNMFNSINQIITQNRDSLTAGLNEKHLNMLSPRSFRISAIDMIKAFNFDLKTETHYRYVSAYLGIYKAHDQTSRTTHLFFTPMVGDRDTLLGQKGNYYLYDLTYPCPATCPQNNILASCN